MQHLIAVVLVVCSINQRIQTTNCTLLCLNIPFNLHQVFFFFILEHYYSSYSIYYYCTYMKKKGILGQITTND